jgi:hypothetical protein
MSVGVENLKKSIADLGEILKAGSEVMEDGKLSFGDVTKLPALVSGVYHLADDAKAAMEAGEIADLDFVECKELLADILDLAAKIVSAVKPAA